MSSNFLQIISQNTSETNGLSDSDFGSVGNRSPSNNQSKVLVIEKKFCKIYEKPYQHQEEQIGQQFVISGLLGIINICGCNFLVAITEKQFVGKVDGANIYIIRNIELFPFYDDPNPQVRNYVEGVKKLLTTQFFYFSYNYDMTSNRQRTAKQRNKQIGNGWIQQDNIWDSSDKRYFWNYNICQDFIYQKVDSKWIVPIIQGYFEYKSTIFDGKELEIILISRRRHAQAGTRYLARGLDDDGNVANYVETEQIMCYKNHLYSFVQIRGSVPLFWQQKGIQAHTSIKRTNEMTLQSFDKHLSDMVDDYRLVIFINLLQKARSYEYMLTESLEQCFQMSNPKCVKYTYFDFHTETKGDNFHRLNDLMIKIEDMLVKKFLFFQEERNTNKIIQEQKGVMRTNCLDCLDRTNVTQTKIMMRIVENILDKIKATNRRGGSEIGQNNNGNQQMSMMGFTEIGNDGIVFDILKEMWAENGDVISRQYAGTSSTITSVTKTGKQGFMGKIDQMRRGVERFLVNNIEDGFKHECIKLFLNQHPQQYHYGIRASLDKQLERYVSHYTQWEQMAVQVLSWNCAGNAPSGTFDISNIVFAQDQSSLPDVLIIGLQEMVKLNAKSVIQGKDRDRVMTWEKIFQRTLSKPQLPQKYICIARKPMVGCLILLFVQDRLKTRIHNIRTSKVKTGFGGQSGNKGSVAIRFNIDDSSIVALNCHLSSGQSQIAERFEDLREIYKRSFDCSQKYQDFMIQSHDYKFIFGDLNFRINLPYETVIQEVRKQNYPYLWSKDQLLQARMSNSILSRFMEGELNFDPTYKYDDHSNTYDTSQKKRIPAWCDRILYEMCEKNKNGQMELLQYGRRESLFSDHRPVYGFFRIKVCKIDQAKRQKIEQKLLDQLFNSAKGNTENENIQVQETRVDVQQVNKQFNLMSVNIQDEYVGTESQASGTLALDELLGNKQQNLTPLDELLNPNQNTQSSQRYELQNLQRCELQQKPYLKNQLSLPRDFQEPMNAEGNMIDLLIQDNTNAKHHHAKSEEGLDDLIDLGGFVMPNQNVNQQVHIQQQHPQFNHQFHQQQQVAQGNFRMQHNYFQQNQISKQSTTNTQSNNQNLSNQSNPLAELFESASPQQQQQLTSAPQQLKSLDSFNRGIQQHWHHQKQQSSISSNQNEINYVNIGYGESNVSQPVKNGGEQLIAELFGEQTPVNNSNTQQKIEDFFQF